MVLLAQDLPCRSHLRSTQTSPLACVSFFIPMALASHWYKKQPPHYRERVCVGRSYRNRTYTVGVRGPSATTTPSSIAVSIIYHYIEICKYFLQLSKTNCKSLTFLAVVANISSVTKHLRGVAQFGSAHGSGP